MVYLKKYVPYILVSVPLIVFVILFHYNLTGYDVKKRLTWVCHYSSLMVIYCYSISETNPEIFSDSNFLRSLLKLIKKISFISIFFMSVVVTLFLEGNDVYWYEVVILLFSTVVHTLFLIFLMHTLIHVVKKKNRLESMYLIVFINMLSSYFINNAPTEILFWSPLSTLFYHPVRSNPYEIGFSFILIAIAFYMINRVKVVKNES